MREQCTVNDCCCKGASEKGLGKGKSETQRSQRETRRGHREKRDAIGAEQLSGVGRDELQTGVNFGRLACLDFGLIGRRQKALCAEVDLVLARRKAVDAEDSAGV